MANYTITVNGKSYDVTIEKKGGAAPQAAPLPVSAPVSPAPAPAPVPVPAAPKAAPQAVGATISSPMPGKVIAVKVNVGDKVQKGQELIIVEAMKMHNPVLAAADGVVQQIFVKAGDPIQTGTALISIS